MGLKTGEVYTVEISMRIGNTTRKPILCVSRVGDLHYFIPYQTMEKFQRDWDFVNT